MANNNLNPLSRLLDIDFPEIKRSNWNNSFDVALTSDVGYVKPVFVDRIMAGTRATLDFNSASFANSTISPLYGRYKVKYLAFWCPDRLYMPDWLSGEKMLDDDYPYPFIKPSSPVQSPSSVVNNSRESAYSQAVKYGSAFVNPTSLCEYLGYYPSMFQPSIFSNLPNKNAFAFLSFWDGYRTFFINPQEEFFPVRTRGFTPQLNVRQLTSGTSDVIVPFIGTTNAVDPYTTLCPVTDLDDYFKSVKRASSSFDVLSQWYTKFSFNPLFAPKRVYQTSLNYDRSKGPDNGYIAYDYHYGLPLGTYMPDIYTSWISNENVELEKSKSLVTFDTSGSQGSFTMEQWYLASRIQTKIRKNLYEFGDFSQWIDTNFGVKPSTTLTQPMFLGAFMSDIIFNDVISTVQQPDTGENNLEDNGNLGSRAGYGVGYKGDRRNFFDFTAKEPGTVMIVQQIIPEVFYFEGSDKMHEKLNFNEEFNPIFDALGFQDLELADMNLVPNLSWDPTGQFTFDYNQSTNEVLDYNSYNIAFAKQPYGFEHMAKANRLHGMMTMPSYYQSWSLARSFNYIRSNVSRVYGTPDNYRMRSTYIIPEMYNNIFANTQNVDNFQFYLSYEYKKYQPVSKQFVSFR